MQNLGNITVSSKNTCHFTLDRERPSHLRRSPHLKIINNPTNPNYFIPWTFDLAGLQLPVLQVNRLAFLRFRGFCSSKQTISKGPYNKNAAGIRRTPSTPAHRLPPNKKDRYVPTRATVLSPTTQAECIYMDCF